MGVNGVSELSSLERVGELSIMKRKKAQIIFDFSQEFQYRCFHSTVGGAQESFVEHLGQSKLEAA